MYIFYNPNPKGRMVGDCVIRALTMALDEPWERVYVALSAQGFSMCEWGNADPVWGAFLRSKGFHREMIPNTCPDCYTIADFARDHPKGTFILGTGNHAVAVKDGDIFDSWDSSNAIPIFYFTR